MRQIHNFDEIEVGYLIEFGKDPGNFERVVILEQVDKDMYIALSMSANRTVEFTRGLIETILERGIELRRVEIEGECEEQ